MTTCPGDFQLAFLEYIHSIRGRLFENGKETRRAEMGEIIGVVRI